MREMWSMGEGEGCSELKLEMNAPKFWNELPMGDQRRDKRGGIYVWRAIQRFFRFGFGFKCFLLVV